MSPPGDWRDVTPDPHDRECPLCDGAGWFHDGTECRGPMPVDFTTTSDAELELLARLGMTRAIKDAAAVELAKRAAIE